MSSLQPHHMYLPLAHPSRLNLDNSNKRAVCLFWTIFVAILTTVFITSNFTPTALIFKNNRSELQGTKNPQCHNPIQFDRGILICQDFSINNPKLGLLLRNLSPLHQFAQINFIVMPLTAQSRQLNIHQKLNVQLMTLKLKVLQVDSNSKNVYGFEKGQQIRNMSDFQFDSRTTQLTPILDGSGTNTLGFQVNLGYYRSFKQQNALLVITLMDLNKNFTDNFRIQATAILMNPNYTLFILITRSVLLAINLLAFFIYVHRLPKPLTQAGIQQKVVLALGLGLVLFNDPYYIIGLFFPNTFSIVLSTTFVAVFIIMLFVSWIYMLQKIKYSIEKLPFIMNFRRKLKYTLIGLIYFVLIFSFSARLAYYQLNQSPIIPYHQTFRLLFLILSGFFLLLSLYIAYLYASILQNWTKLLWRDKLYATFNIFFIVLAIIFASLGWVSVYQQSSQKFQILYMSMNTYVLYLFYMYSQPFKKGSKQNQQDFQQLHSQIQVMSDPIQHVFKGQVDISVDNAPALNIIQ